MKPFQFKSLAILVSFFFLLGIAPLCAQTKAQTPEEQIDQLFKPWNNPETPGAAIAVVKDGKIIFKKGYGSANLEYDIPITPATVFNIASVSKQFTAFSILLLAREGKLSLDDNVRKYIPEVPDFGKTITLRQLIHHTSGLREELNLLWMKGGRFANLISNEDMLKQLSKQKELNYNPSEKNSYCNTGYTLLAEVVARVSGQSFAEYTRDHILKPLKMENSFFLDDHEKIVKNMAYPYKQIGSDYKKYVLNFELVGPSNLCSTVEDLSRWVMNFESPIVGKEIMNQMNERGILNNGDTISYAFGQEIDHYKGLKSISHGGSLGYSTFLLRFPDQKFSVIVLSNYTLFDPNGMAYKVADIYLKDQFVVEHTQKSDNPAPAESKPEPKKEEFNPASVHLSEFIGDFYSPELNVTYSFVVDGGKLIVKPNNIYFTDCWVLNTTLTELVLMPIKPDSFSSGLWFIHQIDFVRDVNKTIIGCKVTDYHGQVKNLRFDKVKN